MTEDVNIRRARYAVQRSLDSTRRGIRLSLGATATAMVVVGAFILMGAGLRPVWVVLAFLTAVLALANLMFERHPVLIATWARRGWWLVALGLLAYAIAERSFTSALYALLMLGGGYSVPAKAAPERTLQKYLAVGGRRDELFRSSVNKESRRLGFAGVLILALAVALLIATGASLARDRMTHDSVIYIGGR